jgi:hypothetical protein
MRRNSMSMAIRPRRVQDSFDPPHAIWSQFPFSRARSVAALQEWLPCQADLNQFIFESAVACPARGARSGGIVDAAHVAGLLTVAALISDRSFLRGAGGL